jgi:hypothetical protein
MLTPQFAAIAPISIPWLLFACCLLKFTSEKVGLVNSLSRAGVLRTVVLSFFFAQDEYKSVLSSGILLLAIATVVGRRSGVVWISHCNSDTSHLYQY